MKCSGKGLKGTGHRTRQDKEAQGPFYQRGAEKLIFRQQKVS